MPFCVLFVPRIGRQYEQKKLLWHFLVYYNLIRLINNINQLIHGINLLINCMNRFIDGITWLLDSLARLIDDWGRRPPPAAAPGPRLGPQPLTSRAMPLINP